MVLTDWQRTAALNCDNDEKRSIVRIQSNSNSTSTEAETACVSSAGLRTAYSLVETMVATALLTSIVVGLYAAFSFGFATIKLAQEGLRADQILVQKLETLRIYDWSKITNGYLPTNITTSFATNGGGVIYGVSIAVAPAPVTESYSNQLKQVTVSLSWLSGGVNRNRSMTTLVSQNGIQTYRP